MNNRKGLQMKMVKTGSMIAVLLVSMLSSPSWGQDQRGVWESIEIQVLMAKIGVMDGSRVQVIGHVVQVSLADAARADRYLLEGYKGGTVAVQFTTERPLPTTHVFVQGVVNIDGGGNGYIAEVRRFALDPSKVTPLIQDSVLAAIDTIAANPAKFGIQDPPPPPPSTASAKHDEMGGDWNCHNFSYNSICHSDHCSNKKNKAINQNGNGITRRYRSWWFGSTAAAANNG